MHDFDILGAQHRHRQGEHQIYKGASYNSEHKKTPRSKNRGVSTIS
jgi:hypothetical protein